VPEHTASDLWTLAQTVWGESRGEPHEGQVGVAYVVLNRQRVHPQWKGKTLSAVCLSPAQFSCWNSGDPNAPRLVTLRVTSPGFAACLRVALDVLTGAVPSPVGQATHYFADRIEPPSWAQGHTPCITIGHHRFFERLA
jgi:N-acetylmuramoyl-L-alanine amidase